MNARVLLSVIVLAAPSFAHRVAVETDRASLEGESGNSVLPYWKQGSVRDGYGNPYTYLYDVKTHLSCPHQYRIGDSFNQSAPDLAESLHEWCDSKRVPEHLRVPEFLRGFYWMKGNQKIGDVGFCTSLAEYDPEKKEALLPPFATFVFWRRPKVKYTFLAAKAAGMVTWGSVANISHKSQLGYPYYRLKFDNDTFKSARVEFSGMHRPLNPITTLPLIDIPTVENTSIVSELHGDIWYRPSYVFGKRTHKYWAIRVYHDNGTIHHARYRHLIEAEAGRGLIYERYTEKCAEYPYGRRPSRADKKKMRAELKKTQEAK